MKKIGLLLFLVLFTVIFACSGKTTYHKKPMPDPKSYNAHFGDMDSTGDDRISRDEFKAYFPQSEASVFETIDLNADNSLDHDEWHQFKSAHGMKHPD